MCANHCGQYNMDDLDDFFAQLMEDIPDFLPVTDSLPPPPSTSAPLAHAADQGQDLQLTCLWTVSHNPMLACGALVPADREQACAHLRHVHDLRGNEKVTVCCRWRDCPAQPMQRGSLMRHVLSVHLGLLRWRCETCGKVFSRKGTGHACVDAEGA